MRICAPLADVLGWRCALLIAASEEFPPRRARLNGEDEQFAQAARTRNAIMCSRWMTRETVSEKMMLRMPPSRFFAQKEPGEAAATGRNGPGWQEICDVSFKHLETQTIFA